MDAVLSPTGKPYIGSSADFYGRAKNHKAKYKLSKKPELNKIDGPYYTRKEARKAEQPYRIANGWKSEDELNGEAGKVGGKITGNKHIQSGHWQSLTTKESKSKGGKVGGKITGKWLWINNVVINKKVDPLLLQYYLDQGWIRGMLKR
jgi:hypothetical protein